MNALVQKVQTSRKMMALTFDDGPDPQYTEQLLSIFREHGAKATFFVLGKQLEKHPEIALSAHREGHELGNHTYSHPFLSEIDKEQQYAELERTEHMIAEITGVKPLVCRPPYLNYSEEVVETAQHFGYPLIGGVNHNSRDWAEPGVEHIIESIRPCYGAGNIIVLHDSGGDRSQTVEAVRILAPEMIAQGYELVTVSKLLESAEA